MLWLCETVVVVVGGVVYVMFIIDRSVDLIMFMYHVSCIMYHSFLFIVGNAFLIVYLR